MKVAPDPVMSEVVRQRLELLLAEVRPRHALDAPPNEENGQAPAGASDQGGSPAAPDVWGAPREPGPTLPEDSPAVGHPPRRAAEAVGGLAGRAGLQALAFTREHLAAVVLVLLVGCSWTVYSLLQARSTPVAVAAAPSVVASPTPTPSPSPTVVVHVIGAVRTPGLVELPEGSRVADAIAAAGGLAGSADAGELNLAAVVADGSQVVIGTSAKPRGEVRGVGAGSASGSGSGVTGSGGESATVPLNTATLEQLDTLPGVGPVTARKILDWRSQHGRFSAVTELQEVDGIGPKTYADIAPHVRV